MKRETKADLNFAFLTVIILVLGLFFLERVMAKEARTLRLDDKTMAKVFVQPGKSTILSFPTKPTRSILGNKGSFTVQFIENDIAVNPMTANARSNLFVYLQGQRYGFDLITTATGKDSIILVRDSYDKQMKVNLK